jgi:hypothetical protein
LETLEETAPLSPSNNDILPVAEKLIRPLTGKLLPNELDLIVGIKIISRSLFKFRPAPSHKLSFYPSDLLILDTWNNSHLMSAPYANLRSVCLGISFLTVHTNLYKEIPLFP